MNEVTSRTETKTETVIETSDDGNGNIVETETSVTRTYLYITVNHKNASEMADKYNWNADQRQQLAELLDSKNDNMWSAVLYGISDGNADILKRGLSRNSPPAKVKALYGLESVDNGRTEAIRRKLEI